MKTLRLYFSIFLLLATAALGETSEELKALDRDWAQAVTQADTAKLDRILADDLTYTHSSGETQSKAEYIASIRDGKIRYHSIEFEKASVRVYGNTAILTSDVRVKATVDGHDVSVHPRFLHVWVNQKGRWQLVAHQATKVD